MNKLKNLLTLLFKQILKNKLILILVIFLIVFLITAIKLFNAPLFIEAIELKLVDFRTRVYIQYFAPAADSDIILLVHNDESEKIINKYYKELGFGRWPWPRSVWADVLKYLQRAPVKVTAFDIKFPSSDTPANDLLFAKWLTKSNSGPLNNTVLAYTMQGELLAQLNVIKAMIPNSNLYSSPNSTEQSNILGLSPSAFIAIQSIISAIHSKNEVFLSSFKSKLADISPEEFLKLPRDIRINITFLEFQPFLKAFLDATKDIGTINVQNTQQLTEVIRENKPLYKYQLTNKYAQSLSLATSRLVIKKNSLGFNKSFMGADMTIGSRSLALNDYGNVYINWRPVITGSNKDRNAGLEAIKTYSISNVLLFEHFETMDQLHGYYTDPAEENLYWESHFNNLTLNSLTNIYYSYLYYYNDINSISLSLKNEEILGTQGYLEKLLTLIRSDDTNPMYNYFPENQYDFSYYNYYHYKDQTPDTGHGMYFFNPKISGVSLKNLFIPCTESYYAFSNYIPRYYYFNSTNFEYFWRELDEFYNNIDISPRDLINKIIVLGECTAGGDIHVTPVANAYPGPEIVATTLDNYLNDGTGDRKLLTKVPLWIDIILILIFTALTAVTFLKIPRIFTQVVAFLSIVIIFIISNICLFILPTFRLWVNMIYPLSFIFITAIFAVAYKNVIADKDKRQIKATLGQFVSPQVLEAVLNDPKLLSVQAPRKKNMTVLFSDIRDFTTKSEELSPEKLIPQLNEYLSEMVEVIILKHNGTLDKYMGDAIMAFWGDPISVEDHARRALLTALSMQEHLRLLNEVWQKEGKPELRMGIGINSGDMIVGRVGSPRKVDYTVLGDSVNIASRLEGLNKQFGTEIIISDATYQVVKDIVEVIDLGFVAVKGKASEVRVYSVIKLKDDAKVDFDRNPKLYTKRGS